MQDAQPEPADHRSEMFKCLADPTRRGLFERLCHEGELTVGMLADGAKVSQPAISKHLVILRNARLVHICRVGRETRLRADPAALDGLVDWVADMRTFWNRRLAGLEDLLSRMDQ